MQTINYRIIIMKIYDLRSDTITIPSIEMRKAMMRAEVGDDVYGEDPTVNRLQETAAELTGKKAALFVSSGSMGNLISIFIHAGQGKEVLTHRDSHIIHHELSSGPALAGAALIGLDGERGKLSPETVSAALRPDQYDMCRSGMIEVENTIGGVFYRKEELKALYELAGKNSLPPPHGRRQGSSTPRWPQGCRSGRSPHTRDSVTLLPVEGARCAGRFGPLRQRRVHKGGTENSERCSAEG